MQVAHAGWAELSGEQSDDYIVDAVRHDPAAFALVYERYRYRVHAYIRAHISNADDAADVTQLTFLKALDGFHGFHGGGSGLVPWLFRIAHNAVVDFHRRQFHCAPLHLLPTSLEPAADDDPVAEMVRGESLASLSALVRSLDPEKRNLLALRFAAGLTTPMIAVILGISESAARKRLLRTIYLLREYYHDEL